MIERRIPVSGDPFYAARLGYRRTDDDAIEAHYASFERGIPCACYGGVVYIGHLLVGEEGEEVEVYEAVPMVQ